MGRLSKKRQNGRQLLINESSDEEEEEEEEEEKEEKEEEGIEQLYTPRLVTKTDCHFYYLFSNVYFGHFLIFLLSPYCGKLLIIIHHSTIESI